MLRFDSQSNPNNRMLILSFKKKVNFSKSYFSLAVYINLLIRTPQKYLLNGITNDKTLICWTPKQK